MSAAEGGLVGWMEIDESMNGFRRVEFEVKLKGLWTSAGVQIWWLAVAARVGIDFSPPPCDKEQSRVLGFP
jgi:hypothetical protein